MFTVRPLLVTPSPEGICSFSTTKPTPGRLMFVLGATGESPESDPTPAIARFVKVDPSALLNAPLWPALLVTLASTSSAVISPFRMFTLAALAVLCAPADWATPVTATAAVSPTTSPTTARRFTQCIVMRFISHSFLRFLVLMSLDGTAPSRPVLHDVAARQVRHTRVPVTCGPPAHRIAAAVLRLAAIVVADLELHDFTTLSRVDARRHVAVRQRPVGYAHHETHAPRMTIRELVGIHGPAVEGIDPVVDRHVPGELQRMTVDFDLALGHDAVPVRVLPEKDVEPERDLPGHVRGRVRGHGLAAGWLVWVIVICCSPVARGVDATAARPLPGDALGRRRRHPEVRALRRRAEARLVATSRGQQRDPDQARPDDEVSLVSHHGVPLSSVRCSRLQQHHAMRGGKVGASED